MPIARQAKTRGFRVGLAYNRLREMIVWGTLSPGMRLVESELMTQLGLGRTPIRTALHRLQSEGFIAGTGRGKESLRVAPLSQADAADVFEIVGALESIAVRHAATLDRRARGARELVTMKLQAERYMRLYIRAFGDMRPSIAQHDRMARAIRAGDPDAAVAAVREQWEGAAA